jgi:ATP-dependent Clp protease adaptor protein ClpS
MGRTVRAVRPASILSAAVFFMHRILRLRAALRYSCSMTDEGNPMRAKRLPVRAAGPDDDEGGSGKGQVGVATRTHTKPKKPSRFKVLMLNDDYTPMEFVVIVLKRFFQMDMEQATRVMLHVHQRGVGVCGIFPYEIAETKVNQVMDFARQNQHPLQCTLEKA